MPGSSTVQMQEIFRGYQLLNVSMIYLGTDHVNFMSPRGYTYIFEGTNQDFGLPYQPVQY